MRVVQMPFDPTKPNLTPDECIREALVVDPASPPLDPVTIYRVRRLMGEERVKDLVRETWESWLTDEHREAIEWYDRELEAWGDSYQPGISGEFVPSDELRQCLRALPSPAPQRHRGDQGSAG